MVNFEEVFQRIKLATNTRTQVDVADELDIRQSSISDAKRRNSVPAEWYMKLFDLHGLNPDWLKKGTGPMYLRTDQGYTPVDGPASNIVCEAVGKYGNGDVRNTVVSVYSSQVAHGTDVSTAPVLGRLSIPQSFALPGLHVVKIDVANMEPQIQKGAYVGIDGAQRHVASGELYGVCLPYEGLVIKRVFIDTQNGKLVLKSDNPAHPEVALSLDEYENYIAGRVAWVLQRL